jgi:polar amino acid transport system permease protein
MTFDWSILLEEPGQFIIQGLWMTLKLSGWSLLFAFLLGLFFGVIRWLDLWVTEPICWFYVEFARNTPPVVQILFWYFSASVLLPVPSREWLELKLA